MKIWNFDPSYFANSSISVRLDLDWGKQKNYLDVNNYTAILAECLGLLSCEKANLRSSLKSILASNKWTCIIGQYLTQPFSYYLRLVFWSLINKSIFTAWRCHQQWGCCVWGDVNVGWRRFTLSIYPFESKTGIKGLIRPERSHAHIYSVSYSMLHF